MSDDLVAFLAARLDEDGATAREAASVSPWRVSDVNDDGTRDVEPADVPDGLWHGSVADHIAGSDARHIARHDPARVLREVAAGQAILVAYENTQAKYDSRVTMRDLAEDRWLAGEVFGLKAAVEEYAAVYSDHPDYDPEWAPSRSVNS